LQYCSLQYGSLVDWSLVDWLTVGPRTHCVTLPGAHCLNPGGPLNIIKNRQNLDLLPIPPTGAPGTPKVSHVSTLVPFSNQKDHKNGAKHLENQCSTENVMLATPPTPNRCFNHPKHPRNWSDFIPKSNLESGCAQHTEFPSFQTPGNEIVTPNGEKGSPTGSRNEPQIH
jgi:hypothetical protein